MVRKQARIDGIQPPTESYSRQRRRWLERKARKETISHLKRESLNRRKQEKKRGQN